MTTSGSLATPAQWNSGPFRTLTSEFGAVEINNLLLRASRQIESRCDRRLAPFTGLVESYELYAIGVEDVIRTGQPMEEMAILGYSRAQSLDSMNLVRHVFLKQYPPLYPDLWTGSVTAIQLFRTYSGQQNVDVSTIQYESDLGHVRFALGTYAPPGTTALFTYSGGYNVSVPDDLVQACLFQAAKNWIVMMEPANRPDVDLREMDEEITNILIPWERAAA